MKHNADNVRLFMDQEPSFQVAWFVYECMEFRRSEECEDYNPYFDLSLFGDEWQGRIFDTFSSGPRGDVAEGSHLQLQLQDARLSPRVVLRKGDTTTKWVLTPTISTKIRHHSPFQI